MHATSPCACKALNSTGFAVAAAMTVLVTVAYGQQSSSASTNIRAADALAELSWRGIGPNVGGRSIAVAGSTKRPLEYYFGTAGGGLWKTTNPGTDWAPVPAG